MKIQTTTLIRKDGLSTDGNGFSWWQNIGETYCVNGNENSPFICANMIKKLFKKTPKKIKLVLAKRPFKGGKEVKIRKDGHYFIYLNKKRTSVYGDLMDFLCTNSLISYRDARYYIGIKKLR